MAWLYLLTEDDNDDLFFEACASRLTERSFEVISRRLRQGGGIGAVRKALNLLALEIKHTGKVEDAFFIIALDNDRSQRHPEHTTALKPDFIPRLSERERNKPCRFCEIEAVLREHWGADPGAWPLKGAIAVPTEMLETWLLLIAESPAANEQDLPLFAEQEARLAVDYHAPRPPGAQLKDRCLTYRGKVSMGDLCWDCAGRLDADDLAARSPSFKWFKEQVAAWTS